MSRLKRTTPSKKQVHVRDDEARVRAALLVTALPKAGYASKLLVLDRRRTRRGRVVAGIEDRLDDSCGFFAVGLVHCALSFYWHRQ